MRVDVLLENKIYEFLDDLDSYPIHFALHLCHASEIIGYKHPDYKTRDRWIGFYVRFCNAFHMNCETKEQLDERLADNL